MKIQINSRMMCDLYWKLFIHLDILSICVFFIVDIIGTMCHALIFSGKVFLLHAVDVVQFADTNWAFFC